MPRLRIGAAFLAVSAAACSSSTAPGTHFDGATITTQLTVDSVQAGGYFGVAMTVRNGTGNQITVQIDSACPSYVVRDDTGAVLTPVPTYQLPSCAAATAGPLTMAPNESLVLGPTFVTIGSQLNQPANYDLAPGHYSVAACDSRSDASQSICAPAVALVVIQRPAS